MFNADSLSTLMLNISIPRYQVPKSIIWGGEGGQQMPPPPQYFTTKEQFFLGTELKREK